MIAKLPHKQKPPKQHGPIMRAVMLDVALCLLGVALYVQTKMIALLIGCALIGSFLVVSAVLQKRKANASAAPIRARPAPRPAASSSDSNVIPFNRKSARKPDRSDGDDQKSNWPSA